MTTKYFRNNKEFTVIRVYDHIAEGHTATYLWGHRNDIAAVIAAVGSENCLELSRHDEPDEAEEAAYAHREAMSATGMEEYNGVNQASYYLQVLPYRAEAYRKLATEGLPPKEVLEKNAEKLMALIEAAKIRREQVGSSKKRRQSPRNRQSSDRPGSN